MQACRAGALSLALAALACDAATFTWLGEPAAGERSYATAVSADGKVVVGYIGWDDGAEAFRYEDGVMAGLGDLPGRDHLASYAFDVSGDGSVIVGRSGTYSDPQREGFRHEHGTMTGLGFLPPGALTPDSSASSVSHDGTVIVGDSTSAEGSRAVVFQNGAWVSIGVLHEGDASGASAVSGDGRVIVGGSGPFFFGDEGFVFRDGTMAEIGRLHGVLRTAPAASSTDGSVIVGYTLADDPDPEAFRFRDGVLTGLGFLPGGTGSMAHDVSADGTLIVGEANQLHIQGYTPATPVLWTEDGRIIRLNDLLLGQGAPGISRWRLLYGRVKGVSADGRTLVGSAYHAGVGWQAFVATIDGITAPDGDGDGVFDVVDNCMDIANADQRDSNRDFIGNVCDADLNQDYLAVNFADLALFRARLGTEDQDADLDGNGIVNFADLARFRALFGRPPGPSGWDLP
jgi:probable HAF family extracellular repeat protein